MTDTGADTSAEFLAATPALASLDISRSVDFFVAHLGFSRVHVDQGRYGIVEQGAVQIHFWACADRRIAQATSCRIRVAGIRSLFERCRSAGIVHPNAPLHVTAWGTHEFAVLDPDGNLITFHEAQPQASSRPADGVASGGAVELLSEAHCDALASFLADRIHDFNARATGYVDGRMLAGCMRDDCGDVIAGFSGHTWGGCAELALVWVHERKRGQGLGTALMRAAEDEARRRGCTRLVLMTHSFQAPAFYERLGYDRKYDIEDRPLGHSNIVYARRLDAEAFTR
ncbi:MAG TPA: GNAT family N-acetyltransferase [Burkholderiaceae bacterium]|jgi:GNAT superfamily N-acetyltransferase/catechol 2,3-dioxygenase-like lactoylglutathione lyase family enzyme|nr:GNAT family N-acetyltransferase [Burkholderiaceae bacterium]